MMSRNIAESIILPPLPLITSLQKIKNINNADTS